MARRRLRLVARTKARLEGLRAEAQEELSKVAARYDGRIAALERRLKNLTDRLEGYCRRHRGEVFSDGAKSLEAPCGRLGFRRSGPRLRLQEGVDGAAACRRLREAGMPRFVRVKERPDRRAMLRDVREGKLDPAALRECGLVLHEGEERFYCSTNTDSLA
ncbi:MAG: host-nuclease inhibitor Gam family protein [Candidatus Brocadiia bacterium]